MQTTSYLFYIFFLVQFVSRICPEVKLNVKVIIVDSRMFKLFNSFKKLRQVTYEIDNF
jgi:hypothetical protein